MNNAYIMTWAMMSISGSCLPPAWKARPAAVRLDKSPRRRSVVLYHADYYVDKAVLPVGFIADTTTMLLLYLLLGRRSIAAMS